MALEMSKIFSKVAWFIAAFHQLACRKLCRKQAVFVYELGLFVVSSCTVYSL